MTFVGLTAVTFFISRLTRIDPVLSVVGDKATKAATANLAHCDSVIDELGGLAKGVDLSSTDLKRADDRVGGLLELSESLIGLIAESGVQTSDSPLIQVVIDTAKTISATFEAAIERGIRGFKGNTPSTQSAKNAAR